MTEERTQPARGRGPEVDGVPDAPIGERPRSDVAHFMIQATEEMDRHYKRIRETAKEDPGTAGDDGEGNWAQLLAEWLPPAYPIVTKGRIVFPGGSSSDQIDVLILDPCYPPKLTEGKRYLAGGVIAAFECKLTLTAAHIVRASETAASLKKHCAMKGTPFRELHSRIAYGLLAHSHCWTAPGSKPAENISGGLEGALRQLQHPREMIDWVCVAGLSTWIATNSIQPRKLHLPPGRFTVVGPHGAREVTEAEFFAGAARPPDPPSMDEFLNPAVRSSYFQLSGVCPIGCFIISLLYRLSWGNQRLRILVCDMLKSGLIDCGRGMPRSWPIDILPAPIIQRMLSAPVNQHWNEWSCDFCSIY